MVYSLPQRVLIISDDALDRETTPRTEVDSDKWNPSFEIAVNQREAACEESPRGCSVE